MQTDKLTIRPENPSDYAAILRLTYEAFLTLDYPGRRRMDEHYLIHLLRDSSYVIPELCLVAEQDGDLVGHILYTKSEILLPDGTTKDTITFGPLSVLPERHRRGIGAALVRRSSEKAREMGFGAVLITGVPDYYPKLGFKRARDYSLTLSDGTADDSFMAYELQPGYLTSGGTLRFLPPEFERAENDDAGFEAFHEQFMAECYPAQLRLRPFYDNDMALMERWLYRGHIKPWYEHPLDWLKELRERHGAFRFITHMIAEIDGNSIGFCQHYDCYYSRAYEDWGMDIPATGEVFSIDYLIGEPEYLRRGYGKTMIAQMLDRLRTLGAKTVIVLPDKENIASNRALIASGFGWDGERYILRLEPHGVLGY